MSHIHYQLIDGKYLYGLIDYTNPTIILSMMKEYKIDCRFILFEERFKQECKYGPWLAGMQVFKNNIQIYYTAYADTPEKAIARCFLRSEHGDYIKVD